MRNQTRSLACPTCGQLATIMLTETEPPLRGQAIELICTGGAHELPSKAELRRLWAAVSQPPQG